MYVQWETRSLLALANRRFDCRFLQRTKGWNAVCRHWFVTRHYFILVSRIRSQRLRALDAIATKIATDRPMDLASSLRFIAEIIFLEINGTAICVSKNITRFLRPLRSNDLNVFYVQNVTSIRYRVLSANRYCQHDMKKINGTSTNWTIKNTFNCEYFIQDTL